MKINEIYTAYVKWNSGGKRRLVLVIYDEQKQVFCYKITSKYKNRSDRIKRNYYKISKWRHAGLFKQSYVDIGQLVSLDKEKVEFKFIGKLELTDVSDLSKFIRNRYNLNNNG